MARIIVVVYKITEWFELERTFKGHVVQPPCNEQGQPLLEQVAKTPVQLGLNVPRGWASQLSGQPVQMPHHLQHMQFLVSSLNLHSFSLKALPHVLLQQALLKCLFSSFLMFPLGIGRGSQVFPEPSLFQSLPASLHSRSFLLHFK